MSKSKPDADDPRFHFEIWSGQTKEGAIRPSGIYYVENHNGQCSYAELAIDFEMAATAIMERYQEQHEMLSNWIAPIAHLTRQTVELRLKAMLETLGARGYAIEQGALKSHDLKRIWELCRSILTANGYRFREDARLAGTEALIGALHEIDPSGDLFRFGISRRSAFGRQKSYDRVGLRMAVLVEDFKATNGFLNHWEAVAFREIMKAEMNWDKDPIFDADDFPKM